MQTEFCRPNFAWPKTVHNRCIRTYVIAVLLVRCNSNTYCAPSWSPAVRPAQRPTGQPALYIVANPVKSRTIETAKDRILHNFIIYNGSEITLLRCADIRRTTDVARNENIMAQSDGEMRVGRVGVERGDDDDEMRMDDEWWMEGEMRMG